MLFCMVLHNFILENDIGDSYFALFGDDPHFVPAIPPERYNQCAGTSYGSTLETIVATMDAFRDELDTSLAPT